MERIIRFATASPSKRRTRRMERAGQPRHRSHNPRGEGERAGCDQINPRRKQPGRLMVNGETRRRLGYMLSVSCRGLSVGRSEVRDQKTEGSSQRTENGEQKLELRMGSSQNIGNTFGSEHR